MSEFEKSVERIASGKGYKEVYPLLHKRLIEADLTVLPEIGEILNNMKGTDFRLYEGFLQMLIVAGTPSGVPVVRERLAKIPGKYMKEVRALNLLLDEFVA